MNLLSAEHRTRAWRSFSGKTYLQHSRTSITGSRYVFTFDENWQNEVGHDVEILETEDEEESRIQLSHSVEGENAEKITWSLQKKVIIEDASSRRNSQTNKQQ